MIVGCPINLPPTFGLTQLAAQQVASIQPQYASNLRETILISVLYATRWLQSQAVEGRGWAGALGDMGIDFGGFDAAVAQQILNDARVGARFHEVGGVGMA